MKIGDIVQVTKHNIEYRFLKPQVNSDNIYGVIVVDEEDEGTYSVALSIYGFEHGHGADRFGRNDCWWTGKTGLEVIEEW